MSTIPKSTREIKTLGDGRRVFIVVEQSHICGAWSELQGIVGTEIVIRIEAQKKWELELELWLRDFMAWRIDP